MFSITYNGNKNARTQPMQTHQESFVTYLRSEVDAASDSYEQARHRVLELVNAPPNEAGPALLGATELLSKEMLTYTAALRRLAHYAAHENRKSIQRALCA